MDTRFLEYALHAGITTVLLGGSETLGVHQYVQKLMPSSPPYVMTPLIYE